MSSHPNRASYSVYTHDPPLSAAIVFTVLFACQLIAIIFRCFYVYGPPQRKAIARKWLLIALPAVVEAVGYGLRIASVKNPTNVGLFISATVIILIAPQISAIVAYIVLVALVVDLEAKDLCPVRPEHIAPIWLSLDLIAGGLQGGGGGQQTNPNSVLSGLILALVGMIMQAAAFFVFSVIGVITLRRLYTTSQWVERKRSMNSIAIALLISIIAHNIRFVYRVVEFGWQISAFQPGPYSYAPQIPPVYEYVFDATMMFFAIAAYPTFFYFGELNMPRVQGPEYWLIPKRKRTTLKKIRN